MELILDEVLEYFEGLPPRAVAGYRVGTNGKHCPLEKYILSKTTGFVSVGSYSYYVGSEHREMPHWAETAVGRFDSSGSAEGNTPIQVRTVVRILKEIKENGSV